MLELQFHWWDLISIGLSSFAFGFALATFLCTLPVRRR